MIQELLLVCSMSTSIALLNSNNESDFGTYTRQRLNLIEYFSNLTTNIGENPASTCVDVALAMILSYYDTYYNDNVVPETFDVVSECTNNNYQNYLTNSSPGIYSDISESYYSFDEDHLKYIMSNNQRAEYLLNNNDFMVSCIFPFSRSIDEGYDLSKNLQLSSFLPDFINYFNSFSNYDNFSLVLDDVYISSFNDCVESIDNGYPLILDPYGGGGVTGHAVVAFDYDLESYSLICHQGFKYGEGPLPYNTFIDEINGLSGSFPGRIFSIHPSNDSPHLCSNNYYSINQDGSRTYYCPCMLNGMTYPNHTHNISHTHSYHFDENDELIQNATHYETCPMCQTMNENISSNENYSYLDNKVYECGVSNILYNDSNNHTFIFGCGDSLTESHHAIDFTCVGTDIHVLYCLCGYSYSEHHNWCIPVLVDGIIENICICGLVPFDHYDEWHSFIREYLQTHDYFDEDFYEVLLSNI